MFSRKQKIGHEKGQLFLEFRVCIFGQNLDIRYQQKKKFEIYVV